MPKKSTINLISFILLAVFLIMGMFLVTVGVGAYRSVNARASLADEARMSLGYVTNKLRAYDAEGEICIEDRNGINTDRKHRQPLQQRNEAVLFQCLFQHCFHINSMHSGPDKQDRSEQYPVNRKI